MTKNSKRKLLFITLLLMLMVISSAYTTLVPNVHAAEITTHQKGLSVLSDVVGIDVAKYATNVKEYQQDSYLGVLPQENVRYELNSDESKIEMLYTFTDGKLQMIHVLENEGSPHTTKTSTSALEMAKDFLNNYQSYSEKSFYGELKSTLTNIDASKNSTKTVGNTKLEVTAIPDRVTFRWMYTLNGVDAPDKAVAFTYENGFLKLFFDSWNLYKIGSTSVNLSEDDAIDIAMERAKAHSWEVESEDGTFAVKNFNVTGAKMIETVFRSSLVADTARNEDLLMLYPMRHVWVSLDKFYPPGNVYGFNVYVWADTGEICHIQERFSPLDPPTELVATIDDVVAKPLNDQTFPVEATSNSLPIIWLALPVFVITMLGTVKVWLSKKKGLPMLRFSKIGGVLLCLLTLSMLLVPITIASATNPKGRALIWGSESIGAWDDRLGYHVSSRKHPNEVTKQVETADSIEQSFNGNGYSVNNYQGLGSISAQILNNISDSEANYPRVAVVDFDHGVGKYFDFYGSPNEFHFMFEDNIGTLVGPYDDLDPAPDNGVYDMHIYQKTTLGKTFFAFISTCMSARLTLPDSDEPWQGKINGRARGLPYAWTHRYVGPQEGPGQNLSINGYEHPDNSAFCYIGFPRGSASLSLTVSGSWPYYETWVRQFFAYGLIYDMTINDALDHASASLWSGILFDQTPLYNGFTAIWQMYTEIGDTGQYEWQDHLWPPEGQDKLVVYGNGAMKLYQPLLTVNAYGEGQAVTANVYIDNVYMGTAGNGFRVAPGYHTVRVDSSSHVFHNFAGYPEFQNPIQVQVTSATTITANYYANPPPQYTLSISAGEGGTTKAPYTPGDYQCTPGLVSVTAEPYNDYLFDHWLLDDDEHTEKTITVPMNTNHELQAFFVPDPPYSYISSIYSYDGAVYHPENLVGWKNDGQFATIEGYGPYQYYGYIIGAMNEPTTGHISMYGSGNGPLYVYVSSNGYNFDLVSTPYVNSGSPYWIDCGIYAGTFNYIAVTAEDPNYFYGIALDAVRVEP